MEKPPCGGQIPTALLHGRSHQPLSGGSRGTPSPSLRSYRRCNAGSTGKRQTFRFESISVRATLSTPPPQPRRRRAFDWSTAVIAILAFAAAATVYLRDGRQHFLDVLVTDVSLFGEMLPKVLAGCLIGAFVTLLLPREMVARWVGHESGLTGLLIAAFFGFLLPGGPITIYPVAGAFLVMGADAGAVVAFIVSWTLIGYTRALVWELPFFGADFVIWRMAAAIPLPIIAGLLARIAVRAGFKYRDEIK